MHISNAPAPVHANVAGSKEFDPFSTQKAVVDDTQSKVMSSFGINNDASKPSFCFIDHLVISSFSKATDPQCCTLSRSSPTEFRSSIHVPVYEKISHGTTVLKTHL